MPADLSTQEPGKVVEWHVKQVWSLPVNMLRHNIHCNPRASMPDGYPDHLFEVFPHLFMRQVSFLCEDSIHNDIIEDIELGFLFKDITTNEWDLRKLALAQFDELFEMSEPVYCIDPAGKCASMKGIKWPAPHPKSNSDTFRPGSSLITSSMTLYLVNTSSCFGQSTPKCVSPWLARQAS